MDYQDAVIAFLSAPSTHEGRSVTRIDTHASIVFLAGDRAWKLKRAVRYDYLDFSTLDRRRACCEAEVAINRLTAPTVYRAAVPVTREPDGSLALDGIGDAVDWVVEMTRFDESQLLSRLAARGDLPLDLMPRLARAVAQCHEWAPRMPSRGGRAGMAWVVDGNATGFRTYGAACLDAAACGRLTRELLAQVAGHARLLDERRDSGLVRRCHGDLHLRNIVRLDGVPTLFDAIEFNDDLSCIDVLYDVSFLVMDLWRQLPAHANAVLNSYLSETLDFEGLALLPLFLSCRAAVRAKTHATAAALETDPSGQAELHQAARRYLDLALSFLHLPVPCLVATGGWSGTGKSTLARRLAPGLGRAPGALLIRSDEVRKQLQGVAATTPLGPEAYAPEISRRVYGTLAARTQVALRAGHSVIVDAVFADVAERAAIERVAHAAGVPFIGVWLEAPEAVMVDRARRRQGDASDANAAVIHGQLQADPGVVRWQRLDASGTVEQVEAQAVEVLRGRVRRPA